MFTGIIKDIGTVMTVEQNGDTRFVIRTSLGTNAMELGASVACSGACMTVVDKGADWFAIDVSKESLSRTTMSAWKEGTKVNLEQSLQVGDELGGHFVTGHVDGIGFVDTVKPVGGSHEVVFNIPEELAPFIAEKGSITVDGVSLTVNGVENTFFWVNLIPYTWQHTTLGMLEESSQVNIEIDILARYIARAREAYKLNK